MKVAVVSLADLRRIAPQRPHHLLLGLAKTHEVTAYSVPATALPLRQDRLLDELAARVDLRELPETPLAAMTSEYAAKSTGLIRRIAEDLRPDVVVSFHSLVGARALAKTAGARLVFDLCDDLGDWANASNRVPRPIRPVVAARVRRALAANLGDAAQVVYSTDSLRSKYPARAAQGHVLPNGVDTSTFRDFGGNVRKELGIAADARVVGFVGHLGSWVALESVLEALARAPALEDVHLLVVGGGPKLSALREHANGLGLAKRAMFAGEVRYELVAQHVSAMDVCVLPFDQSQTSAHALPLKLFEYMACGKPVVSTPLPAVVANVGDRVAYATNANEYAQAIETLLATPGDPINRRAFVEASFSWSWLADRFREVVESAGVGR